MNHDRSWMRPVLTALFDWLTEAETLTCIEDGDARHGLRKRLQREALAEGRLGTIPDGQYGDNLLLGVLALRAKFDRETATHKLDLNISMRSRQR